MNPRKKSTAYAGMQLIPKKANEHADFRALGACVQEPHNGLRIDWYLSHFFPFLSRSAWQKRLASGLVLVNERTAHPAYRLKSGDLLSHFSPQVQEPEVDKNVQILWEEAGVMAVFKPGRLPMHESGPYRKNTFAHVLEELVGPRWSAVHRIDRETSGILLCAVTPELRQTLAREFEYRRVHKEYLAIARGIAEKPIWDVSAPIGDLAESAIRIKKWVVPDGLSAETRFEALEVASGHTLLRALPRTGRTNQIRVHAAFSGLPLLGEKLYHPDENVFLTFFQEGNSDRVIGWAGHSRCCLHASGLWFRHPVTGKEVEVRSPMPIDMCKVWSALQDLTKAGAD